jgi:hypothetical protein
VLTWIGESGAPVFSVSPESKSFDPGIDVRLSRPYSSSSVGLIGSPTML